MRKFYSKLLKYSFFIGAFAATGNLHGQVKILFDATKGEMAGCADWVIDYDTANVGVSSAGVTYVSATAGHSNPQQIPTPPQSGITAATGGDYWKGGISSWGVDCAKKGYIVESLPWNAQITYGSTSNPQDLSKYKVFVMDEPNLKFSSAEKTALMQFVQNGGGLFIVADHETSDRNGDGWDSREIWNDFFATNGVAVNPFGIKFDSVDITQTSTNISASSTDSIIHGPMGSVSKVYWAGGTTMTLDPSKNATVKGVVFKTGTTAGNTNAMVAYARYGNGKIAALGDSSPTDDGTGNIASTGSGPCTLYDGYLGDASGNHRLLIMNMTIWLAGAATNSIEEIANENEGITVMPNPSNGIISVAAGSNLNNATITVLGITGNVVTQKSIEELKKGDNITFNLEPGFYLLKVESNKVLQTTRVVVY